MNRTFIAATLAVLLLIARPGLAKENRQMAGGISQHALIEHAISDRDIEARMLEFGTALMKRKDAVRMKTLVGQLNRGHCELPLAAPGASRLSAEGLIRKVRRSVVVVGSLSQCGHCKEWHLTTSTGFALTESGAFATCYHVVNQPAHAVMVVMTDDGRMFGVREVLAADQAHDVAILQVDGGALTPVPIAANASVGSPVFVVSHPSKNFYTFTSGIVARYFVSEEKKVKTTMMSITADFGPGSSGCPVFNDSGAVIGMAESIVSTSFIGKKGHAEPCLVFKHARPADAVLRLIRKTSGGTR